MNEVAAKELSNRAMIEENEAHYSIVIDGGVLKEWVGIGWIELRPATQEDQAEYPMVRRNSDA